MTQTIFITGASTGLGYASAKLFASKGWKVIATMRDPSKSDLAAIPGVTLLPLDVTNTFCVWEASSSSSNQFECVYNQHEVTTRSWVTSLVLTVFITALLDEPISYLSKETFSNV